VVDPLQNKYLLEAQLTDLKWSQLIMLMEHTSGKKFPVSPTLIDKMSIIEIKDLYILISPYTWSLPGRDVEAGLLINGTFTFLESEVELSVGLIERKIDNPQLQGTFNDLRLEFKLEDLNLLYLIPMIRFADVVMGDVETKLRNLGKVCLPAVCIDPVCAPPVCIDPVCTGPVCTNPVCVRECTPDACKWITFGLKSCGETCVNVCVPKTRTCVGSRICVPKQRECSPRVCVPKVRECTPSDVCGKVPLADQLADVIATIREGVDSLLVLKKMWITGFSMIDFATAGIGPTIEIEVMVGGQIFFVKKQVKTDFFLVSKVQEAYKIIRDAIVDKFTNVKELLVDQVLKKYCNLIREKGCTTLLGQRVCVPDFCSL
jgi:hypothetical protein